jgi:hypothetical protein
VDDPDVEKFLTYFYDHCASILVKPLMDLPRHLPEGESQKYSYLKSQFQGLFGSEQERRSICRLIRWHYVGTYATFFVTLSLHTASGETFYYWHFDVVRDTSL